MVEDCQKVSISTFLRKAQEKLKEQLVTAEIQLSNLTVELIYSKTKFGGMRCWFQCPLWA